MTLPRLAARERLRDRRQRHRVRAVHGRLPPEARATRRSPAATRTSSRRRSWPSSATTSGPTPVCVGPFMFDHRVVGDNVTVIKSPYYYDQKDVYLDKIVYKPMPDAAAAAAALKAGDIQAARSGLDRRSCRPSSRPRACGCSRATSSAGRASSSTSATRTASATCRTRTSARRSPRARSCGRRSRRRSTATR